MWGVAVLHVFLSAESPGRSALRVPRFQSYRNVPDLYFAEESQVQTHYGVNGKHGQRTQVQRVPGTFGRQTGNYTFRPVDRPNVRLQGAEENTERKRQAIYRANVNVSSVGSVGS